MGKPSTDKTDSNAALANTLRTKIEVIVQSWEKKIRAEISDAVYESRTVLRDAIPAFLHQVAICLEDLSRGKQSRPSFIRIAKEHARDRLDLSNYTLREVLKEYEILRSIVLAHLENDQPLTTEQRTLILDAISEGKSAAGCEYTAATERELQKKNDHLAQLINEQQNLLDTLLEEKVLRERFVNSLTHDLRTPLTSAKMTAQLIVRGKTQAEKTHELAQRIVENVDRTDRMINDLLDASKIQAGKQIAVEAESMSILELVKKTMEELNALHKDRFLLQATGNLEGFWSMHSLRRVLDNLCGNAIKYGADQHPILIRLKDCGDEVELSVINQGHPISESDLKHIFEPFHRARTTKTDKQSKVGWGIGLTVVRGICEAHGGTITAASDKNGTAFTLRLPRDARLK
jgi:signal transduction histidine kinase